MKKKHLTDPFTGIEFECVEFADGSIVAINPLTNEEIRMNWNCSCSRFMLPKSVFKRVRTVNITEAAHISNVSVQRISKACKDGLLPIHELPNGDAVILYDDLTRYNENKRPAGRPRKED